MRQLLYESVANDGSIEESPTKDKNYRKYASGVDRALSLYEAGLQEWADYISFLNRLLKVRGDKFAVYGTESMC
jgi:hypothetical protein